MMSERKCYCTDGYQCGYCRFRSNKDEWFTEAYRLLKPHGVMCVINYPENNNLLFADNKDKHFIQQLIWTYNTNIGHSKYKYTRSYRTILVFSKTNHYTFNPMKTKYKNPDDKRIKLLIEQGKSPTHSDIFDINLCKNVSKSKNKLGVNQLPDKLVEMLINTYTNKKDSILDPFAGNMTIPKCANTLGRVSTGIDIIVHNNEV